jgi:DNA-binding HxlR family transcriptional regulator
MAVRPRHASHASKSRANDSQANKPNARDRVFDDLPDLDRIIHERLRLGIVSALAINDSLSFNDLRRLLKTTDGNLSVHARKLEEAHYVSCHKFFESRIPRTEYRLTPSGRRALEAYIKQMEDLIRRTRGE